MDERFAEVISEVEGIMSPETRRMVALEELIHSQMLEEKLDMVVEQVIDELYHKIYEEPNEE